MLRRSRSAAARLLGSRVRIPPGAAWVFVFCVVYVAATATCWSLVRRSATGCVCLQLCVIYEPKKWGGLRLSSAYSNRMYDYNIEIWCACVCGGGGWGGGGVREREREREKQAVSLQGQHKDTKRKWKTNNNVGTVAKICRSVLYEPLILSLGLHGNKKTCT